jgi:hypothetical protein
MRTLPRLLSGLAVGLTLLSCGSSVPPVQWAITPSATEAVNDGNTPTNVVVTLTQGGVPVPDGSEGDFTFQGANSASFAQVQPGTTNTTSFQGTSSNGQINFQVFDLAVETVTISMTANITFDDGTSAMLTGTATIHFGGSCSDSFITPASSTSSLSGIPASITLKCNDPVMGGSFGYQESHPYDLNTQSCTASVVDINQQGVANAAVQFLTEAGAIESNVSLPGQHPTMITDSSGEAVVSFHVSAPYPLDVPYDPIMDQDIEPAGTNTWADTGQQRWWTDSTGHTYNPRDGWVTIIAATAGKPAGGASTLIPDPFVDSTESGYWDGGEPFIDVGCKGVYQPVQTPDSNGYVRIWTSTTVVWTDLPYPSNGDPPDPAAVTAGVVSGEITSLESPAGCYSGNQTLGQNETCNMVIRFVDKNANLPSAMLTGNTVAPDATSLGCPLTAAGGGPIDNSYAEHKLALTDFPVSLSNGQTPPPNASDLYTFTVTGTFNYSDPSEAENSQNNLSPTQTYILTLPGAPTCIGSP